MPYNFENKENASSAGAKGTREGIPNKSTQEIRDSFQMFVEDNTGKFQEWVEKVSETNPAKAIELVTNLAEYVLPKLSRSEFIGEVGVTNKVDVSGYSIEELKTISDIRKAKELKDKK